MRNPICKKQILKVILHQSKEVDLYIKLRLVSEEKDAETSSA